MNRLTKHYQIIIISHFFPQFKQHQKVDYTKRSLIYQIDAILTASNLTSYGKPIWFNILCTFTTLFNWSFQKLHSVVEYEPWWNDKYFPIVCINFKTTRRFTSRHYPYINISLVSNLSLNLSLSTFESCKYLKLMWEKINLHKHQIIINKWYIIKLFKNKIFRRVSPHVIMYELK